jgi:hypothetical protein
VVVAIYVSFFAVAVFAAVAPGCARRLPPRVATWALSVGSVVTAAAALLSLLLLALTLLARDSAVVGASAEEVRERSAVSAPVAVLAAVLLLLAAGRGLWFWRGHRRAAREAHDLVSGLPSVVDDLTVIDDDEVYAFAVPGAQGRIVVSRGLLHCLGPAEQRAVIAHERAHRRGGHHRHLTAARLAAATVPVLCTVARLVELTTERWADEEAAGECTRGVVRSALLHVCTARPVASPAGATLGVASSHVLARVTALDAPKPPLSRVWALALAGLLMVTTASTAEALRDAHGLLARAHADSVAERHGG